MSVVHGADRSGRARPVVLRPPLLQPGCADWRALDERLDADHLARRIAAALAELDLQPLLDAYAGRGRAAYPPGRLLAAVLYEVHQGHHSPALWTRHARESDPLRWLLGGLVPGRSCWYDFRDRLPDVVLHLARQAVALAVTEQFTPGCRAAIDGTTVAANATRHKLLGEAPLAERLRRLQEAVAADDAPTTPTPPAPPAWMAATASGRRRQLARYQHANAQMARRQGRNRAKRKSKRTPPARILISPGDAEAVVGRDKEKVFRPLYNVQFVADLDSPLILGYDVVAQPNDAGLLGGLLAGRAVTVVVIDSAYAGGQDLADAQAQGATVYAPWQSNDYSAKKKDKHYNKDAFIWLAAQDAYQCPAGQTLAYQGSSRQKRSGTERIELRMYKGDAALCAACEQRDRCTTAKGGRSISRGEHEELIEALRQRMQTEEAKTLYRLRKQTVERLNADIKHHRRLRRLSGRGLRRAQIEVGLVVLAHNLVTLGKLRRQRAKGASTATPSPPTS